MSKKLGNGYTSCGIILKTMNKDIIRRKIKELRNSLPEKDVVEKSQIITSMFYDKYSYLNVFLLYYPLGKEVNTINLIEMLFMQGKLVYLPVVKGNNIIFKQFLGFDKMAAGSFKILEPVGKEIDIEPDILCMPGVAFDKSCNRIGYGGGFYDRYLENNTSIIKTAFAYDFQIVDKIETESFDIPVDEIFTDKCIISRRI